MKTKVIIWLGLLLALAGCEKSREELSPGTEVFSDNGADMVSANADWSQVVEFSLNNLSEEESDEKKQSDVFYNLVNQSTRYTTITKLTALATFPVAAFVAGYEYRIDIIGSSDSGPYRIKASAKVGSTEKFVDYNNSQHNVRKKDKSVYLRRNMFPSGTESIIVYVANNTSTAARVTIRFWKSRVRYARQLHLPNMEHYVHFSQKDAPEPLASKGCGINTLLHAYHLQKPTLSAFMPNADNLWGMHERLFAKSQEYRNNKFANTLNLHWLATGHKCNIAGYKDQFLQDDDYTTSRPKYQGDFGRVTDISGKQTDGSRYFPQLDFGYVRNDRNQFKAFLEAPLPKGYGVSVAVLIDSNNPANVVESGLGHFILLTGLALDQYGSGIAFYKDPLTVDSETRVISYKLLLDSNRENSGGKGNYSAIYPKLIPN